MAQDEVERLAPGPFPGDDEAQKLRLRLRKERSRPILSSIREWALTQRGLPRSDFGKAVRYMLERWAKLTLFVENSLVYPALLHGPEQIADLPVPVAESPGAVRIGHPERSHLVEYLAPNSVFNSLPRQRSSPHLRPDERLVTIDRVLHHASLGVV